jgi:hypothetical protein
MKQTMRNTTDYNNAVRRIFRPHDSEPYRDVVLPIKIVGIVESSSLSEKEYVNELRLPSCPAGESDKARSRSTNALPLFVQLRAALNAITHYAVRTPGAMQ